MKQTKKTSEQFIKEMVSHGIIEAIGDAVSIQDTDYKVLYQNSKAKEIIGNHVGKYCYKAYKGRDHVCERCHLAVAFKDGKTHTLEQTWITDKGPIYVEITGSPIRDSTGEIIAGIEVVREVTERRDVEEALKKAHDGLGIRIKERTKELEIANREMQEKIVKIEKAKNALRDSEKRFRAIATSTADLIWEGDVRVGSLHWFGDIDGLLGYEIGEFPRTISGHMESVHPEDRDNFIKDLEKSLKSGKDFYAAYRIKCKDGTYRHWEERGKAIEFENGESVKWVGSVTDITGRRQAEAELIESDVKYKRLSAEFNTLLNAIPDNLILLSPDLKILWANDAFTLKFRKKNFDLQGKHCYKLCCKISSPCKNCPAIKSFRSGKEESTRVMNTEGKIYDKRAFPIKDEAGKVKNVIEISRDITAKIHMEEEAKLVQSRLIHANKMTSLGTLVSGVAHEINNPNSFIMSNIQVFSEIWKDAIKIIAKNYRRDKNLSLAGIPFSELRKLVPKLLDGISDGSLRIKNIVDNLRNFSRSDNTRLDGKVDINTIIMTSTSILENQIEKFTEKFNIKCEDNIPVVKGSARQIEQVIINLIMNALQSLTNRKSGVSVSTSYNKKTNSVEIKVKDEGTGISRNIINRITEPFFTTKFDRGGTGLGLSISYSIIKEHNGFLKFKSKEGQGTTAIVQLPA